MNILEQTPPVTRNLILLNCAIFLAQFVCGSVWGVDLADVFGLHFMLAEDFHFWQVISYMFLHGGLTHLFFNMFALWMFGVVIERTLGRDRFLVYYFVCGIGAALCQELWQLGQYYIENLAAYNTVSMPGGGLISMAAYLNEWNTVGASGACYGILLAFGVLYPEQRIMLLIPPIPMKAKYFVFAYAAIEVFSAFTSNGNIAHFAHLGGMLFGWLLLRHWRRQSRRPSFSGWDNYRPKKASLWERLQQLFGRRSQRPSRTEGVYGHGADYDYNLRRKKQEERIDEILEKVRRSGYDSLTKEEKQELFQNSQ